MKNLTKLNGAIALNKNEQKNINGGGLVDRCYSEGDCGGHYSCCSGKCIDLRLVFEIPEGCN